jgi:hypothetical protein
MTNHRIDRNEYISEIGTCRRAVASVTVDGAYVVRKGGSNSHGFYWRESATEFYHCERPEQLVSFRIPADCDAWGDK